jgi:hypothetical protein
MLLLIDPQTNGRSDYRLEQRSHLRIFRRRDVCSVQPTATDAFGKFECPIRAPYTPGAEEQATQHRYPETALAERVHSGALVAMDADWWMLDDVRICVDGGITQIP